MLFRPRLCRRLSPFWLLFLFLFVLLLSTFLFPQLETYRPAWLRPFQHWSINYDAGCQPSNFPGNEKHVPQSDGVAPALSPAALLCRPLATDPTAVPKLIHQSWKSNQLPAKFEAWSTGCRAKHPGWEHVLWTDEDNLALVRKYFPWLEDTYLALPAEIYRADLARNLYMYIFGGVYADLDTDCLRSTAAALDAYNIPLSGSPNTGSPKTTGKAIFGRMGNDSEFAHSIPNAWMAATPGHPFFLMPLAGARAEIAKSRSVFHAPWYDFPSAEQMTGPIALRANVEKFLSRGPPGNVAALAAAGPWSRRTGIDGDEVVLLPEHWVYPFNWNDGPDVRAVCSSEQDTFDASRCREMLQVGQRGSIAISYWSHTHRGKGSDEKNIERLNNPG